MRANLTKADWDAYQARELTTLTPLLATLGYTLETHQLHVGGERYLMSGKKLVLVGERVSDHAKVIVKASSDTHGKEEIRHEKQARDVLAELAFAHDALLTPKELWYEDSKQFTILITAFVEQPHVFTDRPLEKQFFLALRALETQEGFHATTRGHEKQIEKIFPVLRAADYLKRFVSFTHTIERASADAALVGLLTEARAFLEEHKVVIERYAPYLAHSDLAPHNMRIAPQGIFILDYESLHFGNKYESWARFLNYMLIHNPELEALLITYVRDNRGPDEYLSLRLMRIYKIGFLLEFYTKSLAHTSGDLHTLTETRLAFWKEALRAVLKDKPLPPSVREEYVKTRNTLRSKEETARQKEFALV